MTSVNVQASEFAARYVDPEGVAVPNASQALLGSASNAVTGTTSSAPKFGTLIPNRIFVGGIPSNTTEQELKTYFSSFGQVKDVKIINDRLGVAKGSYGFVTFESQEVAEKIIKNESETLIFKDRKLNIGHAIRKQQLFSRPADVAPTLFFPGGAAIPCGFQSGMPVFPLTGQDYSMLTQPGSAYQQMLLQQANGAMYLSPQPNQQAAAAAAVTAAAVQYSALQSQLAAQQNAAAANYAAAAASLHHHQQYPQASLTTGPITAAGGQTSQAAMLAAAVAAASQWPANASAVANGHGSTGGAGLQPTQLAPAAAVNHTVPTSVNGGVLDAAQSPHVAALAAAVAAQQQLAAAAAAASWRWPSPSTAAAAAAAAASQQHNSGALLAPSPTALTNGSNVASPAGQGASQAAAAASQQPGVLHCDGLMSPAQQMQPALLPATVFAPAVFEGGIAAASSPLIPSQRQIISPSANISHGMGALNIAPKAVAPASGSTNSNCSNQTSQQAPQNPHLYGTPTPQPVMLDVYSGASGGSGSLTSMKHSNEGIMVAEHTSGGTVNLKQNVAASVSSRGPAGSSPKKMNSVNATVTNPRATAI